LPATLPVIVKTLDGRSNTKAGLPANCPASLNITCVFAPAAAAIINVCPADKYLISTAGSVYVKFEVNVITLPDTV
jgi:hypothetical protein